MSQSTITAERAIVAALGTFGESYRTTNDRYLAEQVQAFVDVRAAVLPDFTERHQAWQSANPGRKATGYGAAQYLTAIREAVKPVKVQISDQTMTDILVTFALHNRTMLSAFKAECAENGRESTMSGYLGFLREVKGSKRDSRTGELTATEQADRANRRAIREQGKSVTLSEYEFGSDLPDDVVAAHVQLLAMRHDLERFIEQHAKVLTSEERKAATAKHNSAIVRKARIKLTKVS